MSILLRFVPHIMNISLLQILISVPHWSNLLTVNELNLTSIRFSPN